MAEIATIFLSPFLQAFFEKMASGEFVDFFRQQKLSDGLLKKLKTTFLALNAVLEDVEELQVTKPVVKEWLDELKDVIYDAEDVLDEVATEALRSELDAEFQTTASKVRKSISAFRNSFVKEIKPKIKEVLERLETLAQQKVLIGLREGVEGKLSERSTTSLVKESDICGRNDEKETIIKMLLSDDAINNEMCVIAIVGMGGIGKTTLAQLVYNDKRVEHFNLKAWVCVSEEFDVFKVTKTILEAVTLSPCHVTDLDQLQLRLKECLTGKKFLVVLDDVWNENYVQWEALCKPFKYGAQGSKVLVTTRNDSVALVMHATTMSHHLKELPEEDCWSLFAKIAFHVGNSNAHEELEVVGRKIMEKCKGLPLAVKTIGALLRSKPDVDEWDKILKSELWNDEMGILPALRLSYKYLSSHLKRCFAYCSIFPKDYAFKKDQLILLWKAEGLVQEEVGNAYFLTLESRSLFQKSIDDKSCFVMHDLVSDLAKSISGQFILRLEGDCSHKIVNNTRHLSYFSKRNFHSLKKFETLHKANRLRTFLHLNMSSYKSSNYYLTKRVVHDLLPTLRCLRVLCLSNYRNITELPDSIGKFKHLRYLDFSYTRVQKLPDTICKLCNLQTLRLSHCHNLVRLPKDMWKLINLQTLILSHCIDLVALPRDMWKLKNLRHLDITETGIKEMPIHLGRLKCLQKLTKFIIGKGSESCIGELEKLENLRGSLSILELQNVECHTDALNASLRNKKYLEDLVLEWNVDTHFSESQISVLDSLRPYTNLKSLIIKYYGGKSFSDWVGHPSFSNIASLGLRDCKFCSTLPPLGQLHSLQNLSIVGFDEVVTVGREFCGSSSSSIKPFGVLKVLRFEVMSKWEEWISFDNENGVVAFPQLEELYISDCPKLIGGLPIHLPSLAKLEIYRCQQLVASLQTPAIRESLPKGMMESKSRLQELRIDGCSTLTSLLEGMIDSNSGLQNLEIRNCSSLVSLSKDGLLSTSKFLSIYSCMKLELPTHMEYSSLENLKLFSCHSLKSFPLDLFPKLRCLQFIFCSNLESLTVPEHYEDDLVTLDIGIYCCHNFVSFPKGGLRAPSLTSFTVFNCKSLRSLPEKMHILLPSLDKLNVECLEVESFPEGGLPSNLTFIMINRCDKLCASWMGWGLQNLPFLRKLSINLRLSISGVNFKDVESFAQLLPTSLTSLSISGCQNLKSLKGLQHLIGLEELVIDDCPQLKHMPEQGLPASLSILEIWRCPLLKKKGKSKKSKEWRKIAHIEHIRIDDDWIE